MAKKSALQIARSQYQPKLPSSLWGAVTAVKGEPTQSVANQEEIKALFPNTYGLPELTFEKNPKQSKLGGSQFNVGVILSGGQAPLSSGSFCRCYPFPFPTRLSCRRIPCAAR